MHYLVWRLKALIKQEKLAVMYLSTKEAPLSTKQAQVLDKTLDIPVGAIKDNTSFSQRTFLVGSANQKMKTTNLMSNQIDQNPLHKQRTHKKPINSEVLKNALMTRGLDEEQNHRLKEWFELTS